MVNVFYLKPFSANHILVEGNGEGKNKEHERREQNSEAKR